jgi:hypothetical protein
MKKQRTLRHVIVALTLLVAILCQGTWALAGTTGGLNGQVTDDTGAPVAGVAVKASSSSQSADTTTDNAGHFTFISLAPDSYTVSAIKTGYDAASYPGVAVFADNTFTIAVKMHKSTLKEIGAVSSRASGDLIKPGTTSDVYSVNANTAAKVTGLGGGGGLDNVYSALATMPGAYVPVGQAGWYQAVYVRGGDYDQVGYEVDGVPVNRAFDNYPSNTQSALGQQEVQLYTGAAPSNAEGQGLSGFINQVIRTGTYPGFGNSDIGLGAPIFYHKLNAEAGGASPNRLFSYYAGFGGYDQNFRAIDQSDGASYQQLWGTPFTNCPAVEPLPTKLPGCYNSAGAYQGTNPQTWYVLAPYNYNALNEITDRENVVNFHFGIPHKRDSGRDDIQLLWQGSDLKTIPYLAPKDWGSPAFYAAAGMGPLTYPSSNVYTGQLGQLLPTTSAPTAYGAVKPYCFPSADPSLACGGNIQQTTSDAIDNSVGMLKLQYQKNFSSSAYLRVYGYTVFSNWFNWGPSSANDFFSGGVPTDYELFTHTVGVSGTFADQINSKNLVQLQGSYSQATSERSNNLTMFSGGGTRMGVLVDSLNPTNGICYSAAGLPRSCDKGAAHFSVNNLNSYQSTGTLPAAMTIAPGTTCNGNPCEWYIADNGYNGRYNTVVPKFTSFSATDQWDPTDRLHVNLGLRYDRFQYDPSNTLRGTRPFWLNAWNNSWCVSTIVGSNPFEKTDPTTACPAGTVPATVTGASSTQAYTVWQPRIAATYTVNPLNVLRASYGKYDQAPNAAFEQYDSQQMNLFKQNANFYSLGFNAPTHPIRPEISYNSDLSWEHQFKGTDMSMKVTPFYRTTSDQIQQFYLDIKTNFVSGLNVGKQVSDGVEFQFQKGDFSRNGLAALLSYSYTNAYVTYTPAGNGATPVTTLNQAIQSYNAFTSQCAAGGSLVGVMQYGVPLCGTGAPSAQAAYGGVANPYYNAPAQPFLDPAGKYKPYDLFAGPAPGAGGYGSFVTPHVATLVLNYKKDKWAITPALQWSAGARYGYPISTLGVDPSSCTAGLAGTTAGDPRYPYGGTGAPYDATSCSTYAIPIPNPGSKKFDGVGAYTAPSRLTLASQISYTMSPKVTAVLTLANIVDTCYGGTAAPWTTVPGVSSSKVCGYGGGFSGVGINPIGNNYNPGTPIQPFQANSYYPGIGALPFNAYLDFKIKF